MYAALLLAGIVVLVFFPLPLATADLLPSAAPRLLWRAFLGAHATHATLIARCALRHRSLTPFSSTSIIGGTVGYTTVLALTASAISPGHPPPQRPRRQLHPAPPA